MKNRNVVINGQRTSLRLELQMWEAVDRLCEHEEITLNGFCEIIEKKRKSGSRTSCIRSLVVTYFRLKADGKTNALKPEIMPEALKVCFS